MPDLWAGDEAVSLTRFGIHWNGPTQPLPVQKEDGYWTPAHLAEAEIDRLKAEVGLLRVGLDSAIEHLRRIEANTSADTDAGAICRDALLALLQK